MKTTVPDGIVLYLMMPEMDGFEVLNNDMGCVTVQDNGPGIAPDVLEKIFDPYFSTKAQGTGHDSLISYNKETPL